MLRLFETGNREEDRLLKNLADIGIDIQTRDNMHPNNAYTRQIGVAAIGISTY